MRCVAALLAVLMLMCTVALGEGSQGITGAHTVEEASRFVDLAENGVLPQVARGRVRFLSLNVKDKAYSDTAWVSERFDLTVRHGKDGERYRADLKNMNSRAAYCMALSYLGIDMTPVMMSEVLGQRDVAAPFDAVTATLPNVERVEVPAYVFDTMVENYLTGENYSPVVCEFRKPDGAMYTVLIVGYIPETGGFIICDPAAPVKDGANWHTYNMCWHVVRQVVLYSDFYDEFYASEVRSLWQWRLTD